MRTPLLAALTMTLVLSACGGFRDSRLNPFNWFGRSAQVQTMAATPTEAPGDPRPLVETVLSMTVERYPGGAIVRATGLPPTQGWWEAELVARPVDDKGVLVFDFRLSAPVERTDVNTQRSREVVVATALSDIKLDGVREIVVQGQGNARSSRR